MSETSSKHLLSIQIDPNTTDDREKLTHALARVANEYSCSYDVTDEFSGCTVIKAQDEHNLDKLVARLIGEFGVEAEIGAPTVVYRKSGKELLEPIMKVEIVTSKEFGDDVIGDLDSRRGKVRNRETNGNTTCIVALAPMANMFRYFDSLQSLTLGDAMYIMQFDHYAPCPSGDDLYDLPPNIAALRA